MGSCDAARSFHFCVGACSLTRRVKCLRDWPLRSVGFATLGLTGTSLAKLLRGTAGSGHTKFVPAPSVYCHRFPGKDGSLVLPATHGLDIGSHRLPREDLRRLLNVHCHFLQCRRKTIAQ